ncbi:hypothetical protein IPL85_00615 [Candidatus Saccharibacteria bacterium]|nr:MAG: hypothetical protein IPL85_00615 [Candidatus Saccharibacteria bacterium]
MAERHTSRAKRNFWSGLVVTAALTGWYLADSNNQSYETRTLTCRTELSKRIPEGKVDPARPFAEFNVYLAGGKSVARIAVAASVYDGSIPLAGLQAMRSRVVPKAEEGKLITAGFFDSATVPAVPEITTNFNFVPGKGQIAQLPLDPKHIVEIAATQDGKRNYAALTAQCLVTG